MLALALLFSSSASGAPTEAEAPGTQLVRVMLDASCAELDLAEVRRIVAIELRPRITAPALQDEDPWATRVQAECTGREVRLMVDDPLSRKHLSRAINLTGSASSTRARVVALAMAELVLASWTELIANPAPQTTAAQPSAPDEYRAAARDLAAARLPLERANTRLWITGGPHAFMGAALWGVGLRWALQRPELFGLELDLRFDHGGRLTELGEVVADRVAASVTPHLHWGRWRLGAGLRGGVVRVGGITELPDVRASQGVAPWLGILALAGVEATFGAFAIELHAEAGLTAVGVVGRSGGVDLLPLRGGWLALEVGIGIAP